MAPIAASSQSKAKLRVFQYDNENDPPALESGVTEKENQHPDMDANTHKMDPPPQPLSQASATKDARDCPQTPVGRLPLTELLACGDDTSRQHLNLTPVERVLWHNSPVSSQPAISKRRGRKRARSSSSASSSQNDTSRHFGNPNPQTDLQSLQKAFKTPKADPADDLWSRYSLNTGATEGRSPAASTGLAFTQLIYSSSPQSPARHLQSRDGTGLRRALSCIEWPTSAAKRRKLQRNGLYNVSNGGLARNEEGVDTDEILKKSRISFLVEKIHNGLVKPPVTDDDSSSESSGSSPARRKGNCSPKKQRLSSQEDKIAVDEIVNVLSHTAVAPKEPGLAPMILSAEEIADLEKDDGSSDFEDDDLDLEMLKNVDAAFKTSPPAGDFAMSPKRRKNQSEADRAILPSNSKGFIRRPHHPSVVQGKPGDSERLSEISFPSEISSSPAQPAAKQQDEFDEGEDEVSAADIENMFAQYDTQPQPHTAVEHVYHTEQAITMPLETSNNVARESVLQPKPMGSARIEVLSDDEEDFGDDSDFEQFAAECAEANRNQQVSQPQSSVRTVNYGSSIS